MPLVFMFLFFSVCAVQCREEAYFSKSPKDVNVVLGEPVTLPCEVTPNEGIKYYWELNGETSTKVVDPATLSRRCLLTGSKITNTTRRYQRGGNLHITRVDRERDSGQFTCIAEDTAGQSTAITSSPASINIQCEYNRIASAQSCQIDFYNSPNQS
ncbi:hypothetical protein NQ318_023449 [Aromia moschata]|uniref:Ig-like domain-containing protein n=1 Tax=Aromia moschata TaxID=1265417 RepID=A0AAV8YMP6_9CUCU|nr:hypothetical protein NQ318_023449 [Aromia moschata]